MYTLYLTRSEITSLYSNDDSEVVRILSFTTAYYGGDLCIVH